MAGGAAGAMYEYDQSRQDRRTKVMADSIGGAKKGETSDTAGKRHFQDFLGEWNIDIWALNRDGSKLNGSAKGKAIMESADALRLEFSDVHADGSSQDFSGNAVVAYSDKSGFTLEAKFSAMPETRKFVGEYIPAQNNYNFYPVTNKEGESLTGVIRSNVRIELRASSPSLVTVATYTMIDGKEVQMQSYRMTRQ